MLAGAHAARVQTTDLTSCIPLSIVARETNPACGPCRLVSLSNQKLALELFLSRFVQLFFHFFHQVVGRHFQSVRDFENC